MADQSLRISMHFHLDICMIKNGMQEEVKEMSGLDKTLASLSGFYYTDAEETSSYQKADLSGANRPVAAGLCGYSD